MNEKKLFIFDLDGTLVDAYRAIEKSTNFTLRKLGLRPVSYMKVKRKVGKGDRIFMESFFPEKHIEKALGIYREHHKKALLRYTKLRPFAGWLLFTLKRKKKILAIASNRPYYFTNIIVKKLGIKKYFDMVLCADQIKLLKPGPRILYTIMNRFKVVKKDTIYVGDMDIDMETAKRAGIDAIFVRGGSSTLKSVKKYKNKKVVHFLNEML